MCLQLRSTQGGRMCSCRLTVSQTAQVEMFPIGWSQQCDTYMTIQRWKTSTQCTNGVVQTLTLSKTVPTGEEIWILVVAARPGARLLGQLLLKLKSSSGDIFAAGIATGGGVAIIVQVIYFFIIKPRCRTSCRKSPADFPVSEDHPTYAGFSNRAVDTGNNYDVLSPAQVITNPYTNEQ
ncbi:uncharacterized protein LOC124140010 [Haliotis rufescens]|uniref:uncharacterized protein LOC124140010 n=1 Tax=Haliotis rufescens TaxID=6454 RepID=UPI00201FA1D7|nr:uncharacterized protein LOC124140010 [Haliotis rufescens]